MFSETEAFMPNDPRIENQKQGQALLLDLLLEPLEQQKRQ